MLEAFQREPLKPLGACVQSLLSLIATLGDMHVVLFPLQSNKFLMRIVSPTELLLFLATHCMGDLLDSTCIYNADALAAAQTSLGDALIQFARSAAMAHSCCSAARLPAAPAAPPPPPRQGLAVGAAWSTVQHSSGPAAAGRGHGHGCSTSTEAAVTAPAAAAPPATAPAAAPAAAAGEAAAAAILAAAAAGRQQVDCYSGNQVAN